MTTIRVNCAICGLMDLTAGDIELRVSLADQDVGSYSFLCPGCKVVQTKPSDRRISNLLISAGVRPRFHRGDSPPLTDADLASFVAALSRDDFLADSA